MRSRHLVLLLVVVAGAWLLLRGGGVRQLPWNTGQAGSIFEPGLHMGGGQ